MLSKLLQHPSNGLYVLLAFAFGVDEDVIKVNYHKNVELLYQDLIDIALERGRCIGQCKRHDLVFEVAITGPESCLPFIAFLDPPSTVGIGQIELSKTLSLT